MHSTPSATPQAMTQRLIALEIKASFTEDLLDKLEHIVTCQQNQIDALVGELRHLRAQASEPHAPAQHLLRDELPPHY